jgi:FkbM family methyltransferase
MVKRTIIVGGTLARNRHENKNKNSEGSLPQNPFFFNNGFCRGKVTRHGFMVYNPNDFIGATLEIYGEWGYSEITLLSQLIKPGNVVLDVGANIGTHTLSLANLVQPEGFVFSFEPQRITFEFLSANIVLNNLTNVFPMHVGVGNEPGEILVPVVNPNKMANAGAFGIEGHSEGDSVRVITIDSIPLARCNLIKIDVEGMEIKVLEGARQTIIKHRPIIFLENNVPKNSERMIRMIADMNYSCWWFFSEYSDLSLGYNPDFDMLCLPAEWKNSVTGLEPVLNDKDTGAEAYKRVTGTILKMS